MSDEIRRCDDLDERLAPYVDGEANPETRRAIEAHLAACPPCRRHAEAEAAARATVLGHRGALKTHAPDSLRARCAAVSRQSPVSSLHASAADSTGSAQRAPTSRSILRKWAPLSLAATILLAVAGVFLFGVNDRVEALATSLAIDHVKCFKTVKIDSTTPADPAAAAIRWRQDQGWPITVPQTETTEQLKLLAVRRCFSTEGRAAHLMYSWRGAPLSLYVLQENAGQNRVCEHMGREAVIWCANGRTYAVVADGHPQDLSHIVDYLRTRVE
jgi:anti-sigma factor (TIGR02949 family)